MSKSSSLVMSGLKQLISGLKHLLLGQMMRLQLYSATGFFAFAMIALGNPLGNTATWISCMVLIGMGFWIELGQDFQHQDEDDER